MGKRKITEEDLEILERTGVGARVTAVLAEDLTASQRRIQQLYTPGGPTGDLLAEYAYETGRYRALKRYYEIFSNPGRE